MPAQESPQPNRSYWRAWLILLAGVVLGVGVMFLYTRPREDAPVAPVEQSAVFSIVMLVLGGMIIAAGVAFYFLVLFTQAFTFDFSQPVWESLRTRIFLANFFVMMFVVAGVVFIMFSSFKYLFAAFGLPAPSSPVMPAVGVVVFTQIMMVFVVIWAPLEKKIINRRLAALGITPEQTKGGLYVGISNPDITRTRDRFCCIEEDVGMLWFMPPQLIYWGDAERFSITREQLALIERKSDTKSNTALSGTAHVILHVRLPDGNERRIRLHTEGIWTIIGKRKASDNLAEQIHAWYAATA